MRDSIINEERERKRNSGGEEEWGQNLSEEF